MPKKCYVYMGVEEPETLSLGLAQSHSFRTIATILRRVPSTMSRKHARNAMSEPYSCPHSAHPSGGPRARQPWQARKLVAPWLWR